MKSNIKWIYFIVLALIWGSSFILIKKSLTGLTPLQLGSLRVCIAGLFLLLLGYKGLKEIKRHHVKWICLAGFLGTFFPAFCFAFAQTQIDSAVTSLLNATTPIMTLIFGFLLFKLRFMFRQIFGIIIGLLGCFLLIWQGAMINTHQNYLYVLFIFFATTGYAMNVNILKSKLEDLSAGAISTGSFLVILLPSFAVLIFSGFFSKETFSNPQIMTAIGYASVLAIFSSALALLMFNKLIKMSTAVFSSSVTYLIPVIALLWGVLDGEKFTGFQLLSSAVILVGVILSNTKKQKAVPL